MTSLSTADDLVLLLTTAPSAEAARALARGLVEEGLAACASLVPGVTSVFRWEGSVQEEPEVQILLKGTRSGLDALAAALVARHPYEVPEVLVLGLEAASEAYGAWVRSSVAGG